MKKKKYESALWGLVGLVILYTHLWIFFNFTKIQGDFVPYWTAIKAFLNGMSPYSLDNLSSMRGEEVNLPYIYTPLPLLFFYPFSFLPYSTALLAFFLTKSVAAIQLFRQWFSHWVVQDRLYFFLFALAAFNSTICSDVVQGNIVLFEQVMIWAGFWCFVKQRWAMFSLCIAVASLFKLAPLALLGLLIFSMQLRAVFWGLAAGVTTLALNWYSFVLSGLPYQDWLAFFSLAPSSGVIGVGRSNPSLQTFLSDLHVHFSLPYAKWFFFLLVALIGLVTLRALLRQRGAWEERARHIVCLSCFAFSFALPVFRGYNYILLIIPAWVVWTEVLKKNPLWLTIAFLVLETYIPMTAWNSMGLFWSHSSLLIALGLWAGYLRKI